MTESNSFDVTSVAHQYGTRARSGVRLLRIGNKLLHGAWESLTSSNWKSLVNLELGMISGDTGSLAHLAQNLPSLKGIKIGGAFAIDIPISFLENCLELEYADFYIGKLKPRGLTCKGRVSAKLKVLELATAESWMENNEESERDFPEEFISNAFSLERLYLSHYHWLITPSFQHLNSLRILSMPLVMGCSDLLLPPTIEELCLTVEGLDEASTITPLPNLGYLSIIYQDPPISNAGLAKLCEAIGPDLAILRIVFLVRTIQTDLPGTVDNRPAVIHCFGDSDAGSNVETLCIWDELDPSVSFLEAIEASFPNLENFVMEPNYHHLSQDVLKSFVEGLPELQVLRTSLKEDIRESFQQWLADKDIKFQAYEKPISRLELEFEDA